jgi:hypothetical protein
MAGPFQASPTVIAMSDGVHVIGADRNFRLCQNIRRVNATWSDWRPIPDNGGPGFLFPDKPSVSEK